MLSAIGLGAVALVTAWTGGWPFAAIWLAAACAVALEWIAMTGARPDRALGGASVACLAALQIALLQRAYVVLPLVGLAGAVAVIGFGAGWRDRAWALAGLAYAAAIALVPVVLRGDPALGAVAILWMFAVVWTTDVVAYFTGRALGGPKLWPAVSPRKTWSGFGGGLAGGTAAGLAVVALAIRAGHPAPAGLGAVALASALASVASQGGDLAESAMKRRFGVKDSGRTIPGHGGFMDRLDGFAAVAALIGVALVGSAFAHWPARP